MLILADFIGNVLVDFFFFDIAGRDKADEKTQLGIVFAYASSYIWATGKSTAQNGSTLPSLHNCGAYAPLRGGRCVMLFVVHVPHCLQVQTFSFILVENRKKEVQKNRENELIITNSACNAGTVGAEYYAEENRVGQGAAMCEHFALVKTIFKK